MKIQVAVFLIGLAFALTLALVVGLRLSEQAMAVVVGVIAGVAASIPTSLLVVWLATRHLTPTRREAERPREPEPRVIVVQSPPTQVPPHPADLRYPALPPQSLARPSRQYTVIGGEELDAE
jgi:hypothetical protein